jgi:TP901 family phage tail tape measure protein
VATTVKIVIVSEDRDAARKVRDVGDAAKTTGEKLDASSPKLDKFADTTWKLGDAATNAGNQITNYITKPIVGSMNVAGDFEATLNRFSAVTGDAMDEAGLQVSDFHDLFLEMGADTQFSAGEAGEAALNLAKGGLEPATIAAGGLSSALNLAAAGELDLAKAAEISAKQYGVWINQAASVEEKTKFLADSADLLAQAANASTTDVEDLGLGLANAGGVAKIAGLDFKETVQTMALLAPGFSSAADAGTSFKTFLGNLQPTTKPATEAMHELGLLTADGTSKFYDAAGGFIGMEAAARLLHDAVGPGATMIKTVGGVTEEMASAFAVAQEKIGPLTTDIGLQERQLSILQQKLAATTTEHGASSIQAQQQQLAIDKLTASITENKDQLATYNNDIATYNAAAAGQKQVTVEVTEAQRNLSLETIFGSDAIRAAGIIAEQGGEGYLAMGEDMAAAGTAAEQADKKNKGLNFAMESLKGSVETLQITLGERLLPVATKVINEWLIPAVNWFGKLDPGIQTTIMGVGALLAVVGPGLLILGGMASGLSAIAGAFSLVSGAAPLFTGALAILTGPIGLTVAAIAGVSAAIVGIKYAWDTNLGGFRDVVTSWATGFQQSLTAAGTFFTGWGEQISRGWQRFTDGLTATGAFFRNWGDEIGRGWQRLGDMANQAGMDIKDRFNAWVGGITDVGRNLVGGLQQGLNDAWAGLMNSVNNLSNDLVAGWKRALGIASPSKPIREQVGFPSGQAVGIGMLDATDEVLGAVDTLGNSMLGGLKTAMPPVMMGAAAVFGAPGVQGAGAATTVTNGGDRHYHLHINTSAASEPIVQDFAMLEAWASSGA